MDRRPIFEATNPATGEVVGRYEGHGAPDVARAIDAAHAAFRQWRVRPFSQRSSVIRRVARLLRDRREELAVLMAQEMGKPVTAGRSEIDKCAWVCKYYAAHGPEFLGFEAVQTDAEESFVAYEPLGIVLGVMPWNFPLWQVFRFLAPTLMAGNAALLKHAANVPGCALAIEELLREAGAPEGLLATLLVGSEHVPSILDDDRVRAVTLTGSTEAGRAVASEAGRRLKKNVLELGGSDPYLVLEDADLPLAVRQCVTSRLVNSGQSCIAAKRFIVLDEVYDAFVDRCAAEMERRVYGDPLDDATEVGPQAERSLRDALHEQVVATIEAGARRVLGGERPDGPGAWYPPTLLADVPAGTPASAEEVFGPVASVIRARDEDEAVRIANDSAFGLGAAVFTEDVARGRRIARELDAGACFVNTFVRSDPRLPFGGVKDSGYGRELGRFGILEFVNVKTVYVGS